MRLGDREPDPSWEFGGKRTVGPYIHAESGWRRMEFNEAFTVMLDRQYTEMFEYERNRAARWMELLKPEIDLTSPVSAALRGE